MQRVVVSGMGRWALVAFNRSAHGCGVTEKPAVAPADAEDARLLNGIIGELIAEIRPAAAGAPVRLDSRLAADLGLDSLVLVELRSRVSESLRRNGAGPHPERRDSGRVAGGAGESSAPCRRCGTGHDGTLRRVSPSGLATRPLPDRELPRASATAASVFALLGGGHLHMGVGGRIVVPSVLAHAIAAAAGPVTHTLASAQALEDNADGTVTNRYTMMTGLSEMAMPRSVPVRPLIGRTPAPAPIR